MKNYTITLNDIDTNYFHFTWKSNLASIEEKGLLPKEGAHPVPLYTQKEKIG